MFKVYQNYLLKNFSLKYFYFCGIFSALIIILSILEEISFFKNYDVNFIYPYFLTLLTTPSTLFQIFPFLFILTTQFLFYDLFKKNEIHLLKKNGLTNFNIIKILFLISFFIGIFNITIFYNLSSTLKFQYSNIKNNFSNDNKYLAMVTDSGLWIKDEIENTKIITKSAFIEKNFLIDVIINEFDNNFKLLRTIQSPKININTNEWLIEKPIVTKNNVSNKFNTPIKMKTNFNEKKINNLYSDISTLNIFKLFNLKKDFKKLGYSSDEIEIHILKIFSTPFLYGILTVMSSIIALNLSKNRTYLFQVVIGISVSVMVYYLNFIFNSLGNTGKLPVYLSIMFPLVIISLLSIIGLININEK